MAQSGSQLHVVTGAFGYSGKYITRRLLDAGHRVRTITNSTGRKNLFGDAIEARPFNFDDYPRLVESLRGAKVFYNTYWVRYNHRLFKHADAVENTLTMFRAAAEAGVERVVHVSISNPSEDSPLEYFRGKARLERALAESGISHAILRPTVLFGKEDILINNIAWSLRRFPVFPLFGFGRYKIQPVFVDDLAEMAVEQGQSRENCTINAVGSETFTYRELIEKLARIIGVRRLILPTPPPLAHFGSMLIGRAVGDIIITGPEIKGLMAGLLHVDTPPTGRTSLTQWSTENAATLGVRYASELARRKDRTAAYEDL